MTSRDDYVEKLKVQLDKWNGELSRWEAQAKAMQLNARAEYERRIDALRQLRNSSAEQLKGIQSSAGDAWVELARGTDEAWEKMRDAFEKARSHFQK